MLRGDERSKINGKLQRATVDVFLQAPSLVDVLGKIGWDRT